MKKGQINEIKQAIAKIIRESVSTLSIDDEDVDYVNYCTRENGDVGAEEHSDTDYNDAYNIKKKLDFKYGCKLETEIETVDEFVFLNIKFN